MSFDQAIKSAFINYANFNGRACRSEYWYLVLLNVLINTLYATPLGPLAALCSLAMLVPTLAAASRRLHDTGRSGLFLLLELLPLVGWIILIVWMCEPSQPGSNLYGACPGAVWSGGVPAGPAQQSGWIIQCVAGPLRGQCYPLRSRVLIGRGRNCFIRLPEGTPGASGTHCALRPHAGGVELTDLGSTYGTFLANGQQLPPNYPQTLFSGDSFYLGSRNVLFRVEAGSPYT